MSDSRITVLDWLGIKQTPDWIKARVFGGFCGFALMGLAFLLILCAVGLTVAFTLAIWHSLSSGGATESAAIRNIGLVLAALYGAPFLLWRSIVAQKQANTAEQGLITDRINTAVQNLGVDKITKRQRRNRNGSLLYETSETGKPDYKRPIFEEVTEPNLGVRVGAIYALERIAQDSLRDHVQIMEILCAYIRENAPASSAEVFEGGEFPPYPEGDEADTQIWKMEVSEWKTRLEKWTATLRPRTDIQAAMHVIGRRSQAQIDLELADTRHDRFGYRLDLRATNLQGVDGIGLNYSRAQLGRAHLQGAVLYDAQMNYAWLPEANLEGAELQGSHLVGARLDGASLQGADMSGADLKGATFTKTDLRVCSLERADLRDVLGLSYALFTFTKLKGAQLQKVALAEKSLPVTFLSEANLQQAHFSNISLENSYLVGANMENARLRKVQFYGAILNNAHLDGALIHSAEFDNKTDFRSNSVRGAAIRNTDLSKVRGLHGRIGNMFGDGSVKLPAGQTRPPHWPAEALGDQFEDHWRAWQKSIGYTGDENPA